MQERVRLIIVIRAAVTTAYKTRRNKKFSQRQHQGAGSTPEKKHLIRTGDLYRNAQQQRCQRCRRLSGLRGIAGRDGSVPCRSSSPGGIQSPAVSVKENSLKLAKNYRYRSRFQDLARQWFSLHSQPQASGIRVPHGGFS